ncbi:MAG TPA: alpha/beta hydrolase [Kofleriaceae bacterium]
MSKLKPAIATAILLIVSALGHAQPQPQPQQPQARTAPKQTKPAPTAKPSIVLVHGAWADGSCWDKVVPLLEAKGYSVVALHLPLTTPAEDIAATTRAIERQPGDVVLVGHSYAGFVISRAGHDAKVKALVFVDAFGLDDGETVNALLKDKPPAWLKALQVDSGGYAWLSKETVMNDFAPDVSAAEQKLILAKQGPVPVKGFDEAMKDPAWKSKPSWYVRGTRDRIIDPSAQAMFAKRMKAKTTTIDAGHVGMLSKPKAVADVILDAATARPATAASK